MLGIDPVFLVPIVAILAWAAVRIAHISANAKGEIASSTTKGELEALMRRAVEDANAPLAQRIEALETRLDRALPPASPETSERR